MNYEQLLKANLIKRQTPDFRQISSQLRRALKDLSAAEANLNIDLTWALTIAYHAMIRAGRALMYAKGYLPTAKNTHKTIVEFTRKAFGQDYDALMGKFDRLRRRRHDFIYDSVNHTTHGEAKSALDAAKNLIDKIADLVKKENPEKPLF